MKTAIPTKNASRPGMTAATIGPDNVISSRCVAAAESPPSVTNRPISISATKIEGEGGGPIKVRMRARIAGCRLALCRDVAEREESRNR